MPLHRTGEMKKRMFDAQTDLARNDSDLGHSGLGIRIEQLGSVANDAAILLVGACPHGEKNA
jgi:hypothetical protein